MSKKKTKTNESIAPSDENQIDRPYWVDQEKWDSLTYEEKLQFIQENQ